MAEKTIDDIMVIRDDDRKGHPYFMYDSINKIAEYAKKCLDERIITEIKTVAEVLVERDIRRLIVVGCGTPQYTALSNRVVWHELGTGIEILSDDGLDLQKYNYLDVNERDAVMGISHSGGSKATEDCVKLYTDKSITTIAITDNKGSRVDLAAEFTIIGPGGLDRSVPKTRSYITHSYMLTLLGAYVAEKKGKTVDWENILAIPDKIDEVNSRVDNPMEVLAEKYKELEKCLLIGSGVNYATVTEAALKIIEAAMFPAVYAQVEEAAHGYNLMLDEGFFSVIIIPDDMVVMQRAFNLVNGMRKMGVKVVILCNDEKSVKEVSNGVDVVELKGALPEVYSFFTFIVPIYYLTYYLTVKKGRNPDKSATIKPNFDQANGDFMPPGFH